MIANRFCQRSILGVLALCGTWAHSAQPIEIANASSGLCRVNAHVPLEGLSLQLVAGTAAAPETELEKVRIGKGEKLVLTPPSGDSPEEMDATLEVDLGHGRSERWFLRMRFGDTSSVSATAMSLLSRIACTAEGNVLTVQDGDADGDGGGESSPATPAAGEHRAAPGPAADAGPETKAGTGLLPGGASASATLAAAAPGAAGSGSAAAAPVAPKPDPEAKSRTLSLVPHTFTDVEQVYATREATGPVTVQLPFPYRSVDSRKTRVFFQGEALIIDPKTSGFDAYVTYPLRPCLFGRILDPETQRSLVFHKYGVHDMKTLLPFLTRLGCANPGKLQATLYTAEQSPEQFSGHARAFGGTTQKKELMAVRNFLVNECSIPKENIELRFFGLGPHRALPGLGQYEGTVLTAGASRTGEVFHTSIARHDLFGLADLPAPDQARRARDGAQTFKDLSALDRMVMTQQAIDAITAKVRAHYDTDPSRTTYWSRGFYCADDRLDVPGAALGALFKLQFVKLPVRVPGDPVKTQFGTKCVECAPGMPAASRSAARPAAAAAEAKSPSATPGAGDAKKKHKKKNRKHAGASAAAGAAAS